MGSKEEKDEEHGKGEEEEGSYAGEHSSSPHGGDFSKQAERSVAEKACSREKLQVRGRGIGSKIMRGGLRTTLELRGDASSSEGGRPGRVQGQRRGGSRGRVRRSRGRGEVRGRIDLEGPGSMDGTGTFSSSAESDDDEHLGDVRQTRTEGNLGRVQEATFDGSSRTHPVDSTVEATFEGSKELTQWVSEITFVSNCYSDAQLAGTASPGLQLAFDGSEESGPAVTLPLFKSAMISNSAEVQQGQSQPCNDIVLHIGGPVWALDWCPRRPGWVHSGNEKLEFLAVSAHPSSAPYNRLGKPLKGQGHLQIWAFDFSTIDHLTGNRHDGGGSRGGSSSKTAGKRTRSGSRDKNGGTGNGRNMDIRIPGPDVAAEFHGDLLLLDDARTGHDLLSNTNSDNGGDSYVVQRNGTPAFQAYLASSSWGRRPRKLKESARARGSGPGLIETGFPRWYRKEGPANMVLSLVHDGLVTWDAKWRPVGETTSSGTEREMFRLGFLALLLGDGSIQVFDVPLPSLLPTQSSRGPLTESVPSAVRLEPIFRCSDLESGGHKSIPLSLEWSTWDPHDLILVGFHDATVGLWKFFPSSKGKGARPLMFFTADSLPLRSVAWAPDASGSSGKCVFVTAGQTGWVKFWDIRDPFRPLWDLQVSRGCIHSVDWIPWPRCVLMTLDDGTLRILGLDNASSHTPETREPWHGTHSQGIQCYLCSSFPIWDAQVSRSTGIVAYAGANGSVLQFQLTERAIVKEGARAREPHYLCGAFVANSEFGPVTLTSLEKTAPAQMRKSSTEWSNRPRTMRGFLATCTVDNESKQVGTGLELAVTADEFRNVARVRKKHSKALGKIRSKGASQSHRKADPELLPSYDDRMALVSLQISAPPVFELQEEQSLTQNTNRRMMAKSLTPADNCPCQRVSVHRLRWNCNPNREHWLAYGGAAGIVRCQQIFSMKK
ncbi:unnamed protein product [Calypogeia fissa]